MCISVFEQWKPLIENFCAILSGIKMPITVEVANPVYYHRQKRFRRQRNKSKRLIWNIFQIKALAKVTLFAFNIISNVIALVDDLGKFV